MSDCEKAFDEWFPKYKLNSFNADKLDCESSFRMAWELQEKKLDSARKLIERVKKLSCNEVDQNNCLACDAKQWLGEIND